MAKTWLADRIRAMLPSREELEGNRMLRPVAHLLLRPALWRFTRRSVPRAIGLGLLVGIFVMIPFVQPLSAALLAIPFRANVPLTAGTTLLSNPVTTPLIVIASLWIASALFGMETDPGSVMRMIHAGASFADWKHWLLSSAAPGLLSGLTVLAVASGVIGYALATIGWRIWIGHKWHARARERGARCD
ncbi:MAG TPA: DUF2062 domain-containing protein [Sphingomonas sp.]|uniref:DUF2062 domain-containing protein n=1 Tax=Sphingomonas sp. TaxID=28214 RepID=UPI002EDAD90B